MYHSAYALPQGRKAVPEFSDRPAIRTSGVAETIFLVSAMPSARADQKED